MVALRVKKALAKRSINGPLPDPGFRQDGADLDRHLDFHRGATSLASAGEERV